MKRLKDNSDVPEARLGTSPKKTYTRSKRKTKTAFYLGRMGIAGYISEAAGRESLWWIPELVCIWSVKRDLNSAEFGEPCGHRGIRRR